MISDGVARFLNYIDTTRTFARNTVAAYRNDVNQFAAFLKENGEGKLDSRVLSDYRKELVEKKYRPATLARKLAAVRSFTRFVLDVTKLPPDMEKNLESGHVGRVLPEPLTPGEIKRLVAEIDTRTAPEGKRDRAMIEFLYASGLQVSELISLDISNVDLDKSCVHCKGSKKRSRDLYFEAPVARVLDDYLTSVRPTLANENEPALFVNHRGERLTRQGLWQILKEYSQKAGLGGKVTPRVLRHSFAIHKRKCGADLSEVQRMLGHAYLTTTKVYEKVG